MSESNGADPSADALTVNARHAAEVLWLMLDGRTRTRAQLTNETGLTRSTVGNQLDALLEAQLLSPVGEAVSTGGRPPVQFRFNPGARVVLAADLGASHATIAVTDLVGRPLEILHEPMDIADGPSAVLSWVRDQGLALLERSGRRSDLIGVGIGVPGPVEHTTGRPVRPPIMPGWDGFDIPAYLSRTLPVPVLVDNDVNLMALGEHIVVHRQVDHLMFVKVATGIGSGLIMGRQLHRGAKGSAGDLGHIYTAAGEGVMCNCGNMGCIEAVASGPAIAARLRAQGLDAHTSYDIFKLIEAGDMRAAAELREAGRMIGNTLAGCVSLLNPSVIVLGGVLSRAGDHLLAGVRERVYTRSLPLATGDLQILQAGTGRNAAVAGAAVMVAQHVLAITR